MKVEVTPRMVWVRVVVEEPHQSYDRDAGVCMRRLTSYGHST